MPWSSFAQTNYGLLYNGTSDHVDLGTGVVSGIRSMELWFMPSVDLTPNMTMDGASLVIRNDGFETHECGLYFRGTNWPSGRGFLYFFMRDNGVLHEIASDTNSWSAGTWHHACGTLDPIDGMKLYVDGVLQSADPTGTLAIPASAEITTLGTWGDAQIRFFPGTMDEVSLWDRALTAAEIQMNMCWPLQPPLNGLVAYWPMDEGSGPTVFDASGWLNDGGITGATFVEVDNCLHYVSAGMTDPIAPARFTVAPNPCAQGCTLLIEPSVNDATLKIVDALENLVFQQEGIFGSRVELTPHGLADGTYVVLLAEASGTLLHRTRLVVAAASDR